MNGQNTRALRRCLFGPAATGACLTLALVCGATQVQAQGNNQNLAGTHTIIINESFTPKANQIDPFAALGWLFFDGDGNCQMSGKQFTNQGGFADFGFVCTYFVNTDLSFLLNVGNQQYQGFALGFDPNTFEIASWQIVQRNPNALQVWEGVKNRKGLHGDLTGNCRHVGTNRENQVVTTGYNRYDGTNVTGTTIINQSVA